MRAGKLHEILTEYPPSMRLRLCWRGAAATAELSVVAMMMILMQHEPDEVVTLFGEQDFVLRERIAPEAAGPCNKQWLELDAR